MPGAWGRCSSTVSRHGNRVSSLAPPNDHGVCKGSRRAFSKVPAAAHVAAMQPELGLVQQIEHRRSGPEGRSARARRIRWALAARPGVGGGGGAGTTGGRASRYSSPHVGPGTRQPVANSSSDANRDLVSACLLSCGGKWSRSIAGAADRHFGTARGRCEAGTLNDQPGRSGLEPIRAVQAIPPRHVVEILRDLPSARPNSLSFPSQPAAPGWWIHASNGFLVCVFSALPSVVGRQLDLVLADPSDRFSGRSSGGLLFHLGSKREL